MVAWDQDIYKNTRQTKCSIEKNNELNKMIVKKTRQVIEKTQKKNEQFPLSNL